MVQNIYYTLVDTEVTTLQDGLLPVVHRVIILYSPAPQNSLTSLGFPGGGVASRRRAPSHGDAGEKGNTRFALHIDNPP